MTTWIIAINVAVFVLGGLLSAGSQSPIAIESVQRLVEDAPPRSDRSVADVQFTVERAMGESSPGVASKPIVERETGRVVGVQEYLIHPNPVVLFGHFSTYTAFTRLEVWRFVTFQFLHANFLHLGLNMLALYFFAPFIEQRMGSRKRFLAFYLACGVCGAGLYLLLNLLGAFGLSIPGVLDIDITTPLVGASAGVFGVLVAAAKFAPHGKMLVFFVLPLSIRTGVYLMLGLTVANLLFGGWNQGGEAAHLGGAMAGFYFSRRLHLLDDFFDVFGKKKEKPRGSAKPARSERALSAKEEARLDGILDKIRREGADSLSASDRKFLESASERKRG